MTEGPGAPNIANELAKERNRAAAERTLMGWIRTALALIGFGFGISKLSAYLETAGLTTVSATLQEARTLPIEVTLLSSVISLTS